MNNALNPNPLVRLLDKEPKSFTKQDLIKVVEEFDVEMINFHYVAGDGRLKTLNFIIQDYEHLNSVLSVGERADGSSLFKNIDAGASDLYVIPKYKTAFMNPFSEIPSLDFLCAYYDKDGSPLQGAPENILKKAHQVLKERTGYNFQVMGELEYYVISEEEDLFLATDQRGYHESAPFNKWEEFRTEVMAAIASVGGKIKYGHSEVGNFHANGYNYEQNEIEFLPCDVEDAANQLIVAKWIMRNLAYKYGITITFAPKITVGKAGSGMHIHTRLMKDGKNAFVDDKGLSDVAKRTIAGYLDVADALSAFGNTNPTSYFRLVPHQEAPTNICWGDRNRSVLVRVPLGWKSGVDMVSHANPQQDASGIDFKQKQTIELRSPDGSADIFLLLAGLTVAARHGLEMENALDYAEKTYVDVNIFHDEYKNLTEELSQLPTCCFDAADCLIDKQEVFTKYNVFPQKMIDSIAKNLRSYNDKNLRQDIQQNEDKLMEIVNEFFHCG